MCAVGKSELLMVKLPSPNSLKYKLSLTQLWQDSVNFFVSLKKVILLCGSVFCVLFYDLMSCSGLVK